MPKSVLSPHVKIGGINMSNGNTLIIKKIVKLFGLSLRVDDVSFDDNTTRLLIQDVVDVSREKPENNLGPWKIEYDNDTGPGDESFSEWWYVTNDNISLKCYNKKTANWLCSLLNKVENCNA